MFWFEAAASCSDSQLWVAVERRVIMGEPCFSGEQEMGAGFLYGSEAGARVGPFRGLVLVGSKAQGNST